jgi:hypothetical protein
MQSRKSALSLPIEQDVDERDSGQHLVDGCLVQAGVHGEFVCDEPVGVRLPDERLEVAGGSLDVGELMLQRGLRELECVDDRARTRWRGAGCSFGNGEKPVWFAVCQGRVRCVRDVGLPSGRTQTGRPVRATRLR